MPTELIADTNVWYDLAAGRRYRSDQALAGRLFATPSSFLEITGKLTTRSFGERRDAAQAVLDYADDIIDDPETYLARVWDLGTPNFGIDWQGGFVAIRDSKSLAEVVGGVRDSAIGIIRRVNVQAAEAARLDHWDAFAREVEDLIEEEVPGYRESRAKGKFKRMRGSAWEAYEKKMLAPTMINEFIDATHARACVAVGQPPTRPSPTKRLQAGPAVSVYAHLYAAYFLGCAREFAPQPNDWGDLEHFIYADGRRVIVTSDQRWHRLAAKVGVSQAIRN
jgi:hypothetical protein